LAGLRETDPEIAEAIGNEIDRLQHKLQLIASENYASEAVMRAQGSVMTNKYAEGYPYKRYYGGCEFVDVAEALAIERAKKIFGAEHVNVQAHSGSGANMAVYFSVLEMGDRILSMDLNHGGHLSHGAKVSFSGKYFEVAQYGVGKETGRIDYAEVERIARKFKPKLIVCGASAYPREVDFKAFREAADSVDAYLMADIAHIAGLIAGGVHQSPVKHADFITTTTHKTLRGPRGGMIMCKEEFAKQIDKMVFPGTQGGPLMHAIAAKAVCFKEAMEPEFKEYQGQVVRNCKKMAEVLMKEEFDLVSGGTDNHLILVDLNNKNITGKDAEEALEEAGITLNKNTIPFETRSPFITSGIRIGTPAVTTRGMKEPEMEQVAGLIARVIGNMEDSKDGEEVRGEVKKEVRELCGRFPIYEGLKWQ